MRFKTNIPVAYFRRVTKGIITPSILDRFPLTPSPLTNWQEQKDLLPFLHDLFNINSTMILPDGTSRVVNYSKSGDSVCADGKKEFERKAREFSRLARSSKASGPAGTQKMRPPIFLDDRRFGLMSKYSVAFGGVLQAVLEESGCFSLSHILESQADIDSSILLAGNLDYKHAVQVLRNVLENLILPLYFQHTPSSYQDWQQGTFRVPNVRGKDGLLHQLVKTGILAPNVSAQAADLYSELSASVHGREDRMVYSGLLKGSGKGQTYDDDKFSEWCRFLQRTVEVGTALIATNNLLWENSSISLTVCDSCYNDQFDISDVDTPVLRLRNLLCRRCKREMTFLRDDNSRIYTVSVSARVEVKELPSTDFNSKS